MHKKSGRLWLLSDNIDTDVILPGPYLPLLNPHDLAAHALEGLNIGFADQVQAGDMIVAGRNFGCGSSREQAPVALKYAGVSVIIAESFSRIFYRNAMSIGLPVLTCPGLASTVLNGEQLIVDLAAGNVMQVNSGQNWQADKFPEFLLEILSEGGLVPHLKKQFQSGTHNAGTR